MASKADLHRLIDDLPDELVDEAMQRLDELNSPMLRALLGVRDDALDEPTVTLYRPVGQAEIDLIAESGYRRFPPRLPQQPIFYPVLNEEYARQIAREWNTRDENSGFRGYVMRFRVRAACAGRYPVQTVGGSVHQELWVPAEELDAFNDNIVGEIEIIAQYP